MRNMKRVSLKDGNRKDQLMTTFLKDGNLDLKVGNMRMVVFLKAGNLNLKIFQEDGKSSLDRMVLGEKHPIH